MEAVLALTSLHIASGTEDIRTANRHVSAALHYQHQAVIGLRSTLDTLSPANCDAVFISSMIIMVCTIVSPLLLSKCNQQSPSTAEAMLGLTDFLKGMESILGVSRKWLSEGPISYILVAGVNITTASLCFPREEMRRLIDEKSSGQTRLVFEHALDTLEQVARRGRSVVPWIAAVKPEFLEALRDGNDIALAVFMQWGVLLDQFDGMWWAKFSGRRLVDEISATLKSRGDEWMLITEWCRAEVGLH
ncbi:Nn.00g096510.m01.CDS01 [Neocucurbitaria sp. VM-36]